MAPAVALLIAVVWLGVRFNKYQDAATQAAFRAQRIELVSRTRLALASASAAEKSAVMAVTDEDSQRYADQARAATQQTESARRDLAQLLQQGGTPGERELLAQFSQYFSDFQRIDSDLLALAVKNSNVKAYGLAFGPAAQSIDEMDDALSRIVAKSTAWPDARKVALDALAAQAAALRIETLLAPHIAEESDKKMDELEAIMSAQARKVQKALDGLSGLAKVSGDPDLAAATSAYGRFSALRTRILALSRENANVRSLAISLTQKRRAMSLCEETLAALEQAILAEPVPGAIHPTRATR
jgi:hypothetical protein